MPYISIKAYPRDKATNQKLVEEIQKTVLNVFGCKPEALTIAFEEVAKEDWKEKVDDALVAPDMDHVMILKGQKRY